MKRLLLFVLGAAIASAAEEIVVDFETATAGKPIPTWTEQGVVFALAAPPRTSKAVGRVMFFPHLASNRKGLVNAMANEQAIPVRATFPRPVATVTVVFWASTGCPAKLTAYDRNGNVVDTASLPAAPARRAPGDPVPTFELRVQGPAIGAIEISGPRNGEFLAADEIRFRPE